MAQPSHPAPAPPPPPLAQPVAVVNPQYCVSYPVDLLIAKKVLTLKEGSCEVTDINGNVMFRVKGKMFSLHDQRVLIDAVGTPILSLRQKIMTAHRRWEVYRGESKDSKDLLFSAKKSSILQFKTELNVFLAANTSEDACDFKVKGSWGERSCTIFLGDTNTIIAQMHRKHNLQSMVLGKESFGVTVYPNVDYAFIVALVVLLEEINEDRSGDD
ncbi:hypothetical protein NMG60_11000098 [Bertholletia excelsa]